MVILDTSFFCIKIPIENYSWFLFFTIIKITNQSSILLPIVFCIYKAVTFRFLVYLLSNI